MQHESFIKKNAYNMGHSKQSEFIIILNWTYSRIAPELLHAAINEHPRGMSTEARL